MSARGLVYAPFYLVGLVVGLLVGCQQALTEIVVVVDTDYDVPTELDDVEIVVTEPDGTMQSVVASLSTTPLPITLGLVHRAGATGPLHIDVRGRIAASTRVRREMITEFVLGETREARLDLLRDCDGFPCGDGTGLTCAAGACVSIAFPGADLPRFSGTPSRNDVGPIDTSGFDGGLDDTGHDSCVGSGAEACDGFDQDCDGRIDEGACTCDPPCMLDHATAICTATRTCAIASCELGFANCDMMPETGCERSVRTNSDCGSCDRVCASMVGTTTCTDGTCRIATCTDVNLRDCDGELATGCEVRVLTDNAHCGMCFNPCPGGTRCRMGRCS